MPRQQQKQRGWGSQAPLPLHAPVTAMPRGQGSASAMGTGSNRGSTGEASGSRCPQRGFPGAGMALSWCQPSLPPPLTPPLVPWTGHGEAAPRALPSPGRAGASLPPCPFHPPALYSCTCWTPRPRLSGGRGEGHTLPHSNLHSEGGGGRGGGSLQTGHSPGPDTPSSAETGLSSQQLMSGEKGARGAVARAELVAPGLRLFLPAPAPPQG